MRLTGNYRLVTNIDATPTQTPGNEFLPIGNHRTRFQGTFDGNGHTINGLRLKPSPYQTGMFGFAENAVIRNVGLTNVSISGYQRTGALAGVTIGTQISSCYVTGTVSGIATGTVPWSGVGMMVGTAYAGTTLSRVYATGTINGPVANVGGIVGSARGGGELHERVQILEAFANVTISPTFLAGSAPVAAGGLVGTLMNGELLNVHTWGNITGHYSGGLIGYAQVNSSGFVNSSVRAALTHAIVTVHQVPNRTGAIGHYDTGAFVDCGTIMYNTTTDGGVLAPGALGCQSGLSASVLRGPDGSPDPYPYIFGEHITNPNNPRYPASDGVWDLTIWNHNSSSQYSTLRNIPNPSVQPR